MYGNVYPSTYASVYPMYGNVYPSTYDNVYPSTYDNVYPSTYDNVYPINGMYSLLMYTQYMVMYTL